ncbi:MAG TPA: FAD binding domain-containing protein [Aggregatilineales bacterium]|nr:FAD binding domain-containing protein [Aggregatilineales bacterium]
MLYNLREYHRPRDLDEALRLLQRPEIRTVPLAGGTDLVGQRNPDVEAVVDLSELGLDTIHTEDGVLRLGAMVRLQTIVEQLGDAFGGLLAEAAHRMAGWNIRNVATIGGTLAAGKVDSPLGVALAALGAEMAVTGQDELIPWPGVPAGGLQGRLITAVELRLAEGKVGTAYEQVARTPVDQPIVSAAAVVREVEGGTLSIRVAVGGLLASGLKLLDFDIQWPDLSGLDALTADINPADVKSDYLGRPDYRLAIAPVVARRALSAALARIGYETEAEGGIAS